MLAKADGVAATDMTGGTPRPRLKPYPKKMNHRNDPIIKFLYIILTIITASCLVYVMRT